jgi:soluble lytic murein transglycosylase-like protein
MWRTALAWALTGLFACLAVVLLAWPAAAAPGFAAPQINVQGAGVPTAALRWRSELQRAAHSQWGLDAPMALLAAQVHQESAWNPGAVSHVGAAGLGQFMPATATWWCASGGTPAAQCQPTNPTWALRSLVGYDKWLYARLAVAGPDPARWWATLRAYNGGLGHWLAEAKAAGSYAQPAVDAACGRARRHTSHCAENLGYPHRIMASLQPRYTGWGLAVLPPRLNAAQVPL